MKLKLTEVNYHLRVGLIAVLVGLSLAAIAMPSQAAQALVSGAQTTGGTTTQTTTQAYQPPTNDSCGDAAHGGPVKLSINIGCKGKGNPIADMAFAIIRILSDGVGLIVIGSIVVAGIQYSASQGDPQATAQAVKRIRSSFTALLIFIFGYAILNYLIPGAFL
jgi:hypothetical protein